MVVVRRGRRGGIPGDRSPVGGSGELLNSVEVGSMQRIWVAAGIGGGHLGDATPPKGPRRSIAHPSGIVPLQLKWGVGVADLHRE